jgi:hypothetical protein
MKEKLALLTIAAAAMAVASPWAHADPAATFCPPVNFANGMNLAKNPSFEIMGPKGPSTSGPPWPTSPSVTIPSAAADWFVHSDNYAARVTTKWVNTMVPGGTNPARGNKMLHIVAKGGEGGVHQRFSQPPAPRTLMFSAWVFVKSGRVVVQPHSGGGGPAAVSSPYHLNQWVQLRACTDSAKPDTMIIIWSYQGGAEFFIDRVEVREVAPG